MFQTILVPVDLAHLDEGQKDLDIASGVVNPDGEIILLYVIEDIPNWTDIDLPPNFKENAIATARQQLESIAETTDKKVKIDIREGHAYSTILKEADKLNADLIILASHKPGLKEYFIGSNTTKVVSHANCSVLVIR